jgi:hypothetical protein
VAVGFFRRDRETLNEQLLHEAGLADEKRRKQTRLEAPDPALFSLLAGVTGPELCDAFAVTEAPGLDCDEIAFWTLEDGELLVAEAGTANVSELADAVEEHIERPYKALAARQDGTCGPSRRCGSIWRGSTSPAAIHSRSHETRARPSRSTAIRAT